ncbi:MAG: hypothetical protein AAF959_23960, partial [Cyanobacteria bacterium P01_D01_bin.56]
MAIVTHNPATVSRYERLHTVIKYISNPLLSISLIFSFIFCIGAEFQDPLIRMFTESLTQDQPLL